MTIRIENRNGQLVGVDDQGNEVQIDFKSVGIDDATINKELALPQYDEVSNAPATEGRVVWVTGAGATTPAGVYQHNGSQYDLIAVAGVSGQAISPDVVNIGDSGKPAYARHIDLDDALDFSTTNTSNTSPWNWRGSLPPVDDIDIGTFTPEIHFDAEMKIGSGTETATATLKYRNDTDGATNINSVSTSSTSFANVSFTADLTNRITTTSEIWQVNVYLSSSDGTTTATLRGPGCEVVLVP